MEQNEKQSLKTKILEELKYTDDFVIEDAELQKKLSIKYEKVADRLIEIVAKDAIRENLKILFEYEEHYLNLLKDHKEEIKFASALQEDLRKERAKFFAETLKEVSNTLQETKLDAKVTSSWIVDLVKSYTKSLDLSSDMAKEETLDIIGNIKQKAKETVNDENVN